MRKGGSNEVELNFFGVILTPGRSIGLMSAWIRLGCHDIHVLAFTVAYYTQIKLALSIDKRHSLIQIFIKAMFSEGHKYGTVVDVLPIVAQGSDVDILPYYLARAVDSREPDLGKAVVSDFVHSLSGLQ